MTPHNRNRAPRPIPRPITARSPTTVTDVSDQAGPRLGEGDRLGNRYLLQRQIGAGGMSVVWRAWDEALQRPVAVKVMNAPLSTGLGDRELIRREARAAARIEHPDAMGVYDVGEAITTGGRLTAYVVMRLLDGHSLADLLDDGPLVWPDALEIVYRVANVLSTAHANGIVHRDVTPENVMLTDEGAKLLDFGIAAKVGERDDEQESPVFGTPPFVAPERLHGAQAEGATDVYALGVLMFQMLTGAFPYPEITWEELEHAHRPSRPPRPTGVPGLPRRAAKLCQRCLANHPADRPTAAEVAAELAAILTDDGQRLHRHARRAAGVVVAAIVMATAAVILTDPSLRDGQSAGTGTSPRLTPSPLLATPTQASASPSPPASASRSATQSRKSSAPQLSPLQANAAVHALLDRGVAEKTVRTDVAVDIGQQADNLTNNPASTATERQRQTDTLRRNIQIRFRDRDLTAQLAADLDAAVAALGAAIEHARASSSPAGGNAPA